ncbi:hypothetical protein ACQ4PT_009243 [Festuca glaucescens]
MVQLPSSGEEEEIVQVADDDSDEEETVPVPEPEQQVLNRVLARSAREEHFRNQVAVPAAGSHVLSLLRFASNGFYGDSADEDGFLVGWPAMGNSFTDEADDFLPPLRARDSWTPFLLAHSSGPGHFAPSPSAHCASEFLVGAHSPLAGGLACYLMRIDGGICLCVGTVHLSEQLLVSYVLGMADLIGVLTIFVDIVVRVFGIKISSIELINTTGPTAPSTSSSNLHANLIATSEINPSQDRQNQAKDDKNPEAKPTKIIIETHSDLGEEEDHWKCICNEKLKKPEMLHSGQECRHLIMEYLPGGEMMTLHIVMSKPDNLLSVLTYSPTDIFYRKYRQRCNGNTNICFIDLFAPIQGIG